MGSELGKELGWDDVIEKGEGGFVLLPEGDYDFTVESFERGRFNGSEKMPACNKAILKLRVNAPEGSTLITEGLLLYDKMQWKLAEFFLAIGEKEVEGKVRMNWIAVPLASGRASIEITTAKDNPDKKFNHIKKFLPKEEKQFKAGEF